jgi:hypothetical protein
LDADPLSCLFTFYSRFVAKLTSITSAGSVQKYGLAAGVAVARIRIRRGGVELQATSTG